MVFEGWGEGGKIPVDNPVVSEALLRGRVPSGLLLLKGFT